MKIEQLVEEDQKTTDTPIRTYDSMDNSRTAHQRFDYEPNARIDVEYVTICAPALKKKADEVAKKYTQGNSRQNVGTVFLFSSEAEATAAAKSMSDPKWGIAGREEVLLARQYLTWPARTTTIPKNMLINNAVGFFDDRNIMRARRAIKASRVKYREAPYGLRFEYSEAMAKAILSQIDTGQDARVLEAAWQTLWPGRVSEGWPAFDMSAVATKDPYTARDNGKIFLKSLIGL